MSLRSELEDLAASLEAAVPLATTRIEHIRVAGHASRARRLVWLLIAEQGEELAAVHLERKLTPGPP